MSSVTIHVDHEMCQSGYLPDLDGSKSSMEKVKAEKIADVEQGGKEVVPSADHEFGQTMSTLTLADAIRDALCGKEKLIYNNVLKFTVPARNGGTATFTKFEKNARYSGKHFEKKWIERMIDYPLKFLAVEIKFISWGNRGWNIRFYLTPFEDGDKKGREISPLEVLEHVDQNVIIDKLNGMLKKLGDWNFV